MNSTKKFLIPSAALAIGFLIGIGAILAQAAWSEPTVLPPDGNIDAPLNIGPLPQHKEGSLGVASGSATFGWPILGFAVLRPLGAQGMDAVFPGGVGIGSGAITTYHNQNSNKTPIYDVNGSCPTCTDPPRGGLDIAWAGLPATLTLGADFSGLYTRTNNAQKSFAISMPHYSNGTLDVAVMTGKSLLSSGVVENQIIIGGGLGTLNAATEIDFYAAPDAKTVTGDPTLAIRRNLVTFPANTNVQILGGNPGQGKTLVSDNAGFVSWQPMQGGFSNFISFDYTKSSDGQVSANGTYTWTVPVGVTKIMVEVWGGGGGGKGSSNTTPGSGGTGGDYGKGIFTVSPGSSFNATVGAGGAGGASGGGLGVSGKDSSFGALISSDGTAPFAISGESGTPPIPVSGSGGGYQQVGRGGRAGGGGGGAGAISPGGGGNGASSGNNAGPAGAPGRVVVWW